MFRKIFCQFLVVCCFVVVAKGTGPRDIRDFLGLGNGVIPSFIPGTGNIKELFGVGEGKYPPGHKRPCPLCDSSVYSYCSDKLFHDSCCCSGPYDHLPQQCQYADCSFLHSNSCYEHRLITQCCCSNYIHYKK